MVRKIWNLTAAVLMVLIFSGALGGCAKKMDRTEKLKDLEFTVVEESEVPEELADAVEEKKQQPFQITFADQGYLYIARGYGAQLTSGYSISVTELYETTNAIVIRTELLGPPGDESVEEISTFPYVVVKLEYLDKHVIFDE
ncbi:MAG: protease complex subunit PrcB family protein [Hespellia sp.]|nr:protease complex subunit PrcB family protein [Hespellia sp.]